MTLHRDDVILNGKYHILRLIGEGGMARVWLAEEPRFGNRRVAIKEPRGDLLPDLDHELRTRYQREVQVCAALGQAKVPNMVGAITTELCEDTLLLVLEYIPGGDLAGLLQGHPNGLPVNRAVAITLDVLQALEGVHSHTLEIVHRDLKPSNILFDGGSRAHLGDFGLAQLAGVSGRSQLQGGQHPGTPMYMAPEQETSPRSLTAAADLYALGCVLFEMLTGRRYKRVRPGTLASELRPEVPRWLDEVLVRALEEDPWERYTEAGEMAAALAGGGEAALREAQQLALQEAEQKAQREAEEKARREAEETRLREAEAARQVPVWQQIGIEMVRIPAGEFLYGEEKERAHLPEYYLSRTPVTNAQYRAFVEATSHRWPGHWPDGSIPEGKENHPVVSVSWADAAAFCRWAGCRLPTEREWEKAARGTDGREYPWGNEWEMGRCNTREAGTGGTTPVERYPNGASPYGLLDMAGDVWEWCESWYDSGRDSKILRGGSWYLGSGDARSPRRYWDFRDSRNLNTGFRCGLSPTSSP